MTAHPATSPSPPVLVEAGPEDVAGAGAFASGAPGAAVLAGALALAAALLLAPGAARAADECGALNAGNSFTEDCPAAAYAGGIIYWDQENAVTLTVPGTAATTTITTDADGMQDSGIAIRTNTHASDAYNIGLTVGGTGPVNIEQDPDTTHTDRAALAPLFANNRGIFVSQRSGNGATTTVDVKSGVKIGSSANRMKANGLHVEVGVRDTTTGLVQAGTAGAVMITNEADIYADWNGVAVDSTGVAATAATTVINRGDITARLNGIGVTNLAPTGGAITVTNEGDIVAAVSGVGVSTLDAAATSVTNHGAITADQNGITVVKGRGAAGPITVTNSGAIESKSTSASANLFNNGILALSNGSDSAGGAKGGVSVTHSGGAIKVPSGGKGIRANVGDDDPGAGNTGAARVSVTGGSITAKGGAIEAINHRAGSVQVDVSSGVALTSTQGHGIQAHVTDAGNTAGQVKITQGGRITARTGVDAAVLRAGAVTIAAGTTTYETRDAMEQPVIDVTWTGTFSHGTTATVAPNDNDRFTASNAGGAITTHREVEAEKAMLPDLDNPGSGGHLRYGSPAGIEAQVMSWRDVAAKVAEGDDPGAIADNTAQMNLLSVSHADSRRTEILRAFKAALGNGEIDVADSVFDAIKTGATSLDGVTDAEIVTYLEKDDDATRTLLQSVLAQGLSDEEKAVLRAVATNTGLDAALNDEDAGFSDNYKMDVKGLLDRFNVGNIRIAMNEGSINSRGDGIRAYYATPNDKNGRIDLTVDEGASVTGGMAGIYVANAGMGEVKGNTPWGNALGLKEDVTLALRQQFVTVHGTVTGGTDAAVHLSGGGALLIGEKSKVLAGSSGRAILVNDPGRSEIVIHGEVQGGAGARGAVDTTGGGTITVGLTGMVIANGATSAIHADDGGDDTATTKVVVQAVGNDQVRDGLSDKAANTAAARVQGAIRGKVANNKLVYSLVDEDGNNGQEVSVDLDEDGEPNNSGLPPEPPSAQPQPQPGTMTRTMNCNTASDARCRLYEALPSVLLAMNDLPTWAERTSAARDARGGWVQVETAGGKWKADRSTRPDVAWDHRRHGVRAGMDFAVGEAVRAGVSVHGLRGSAEMTRGDGKAKLSGNGVGVNATTTMAGDVQVDARAAVTWYDVDLTSSNGRALKDGAKGRGHALGVEAGRPMAVGEGVSLTPRAGLAWSRVSLDSFTDSRLDTRVSVEDADSLVGRVGLMVDRAVGSEEAPGRVFGSVDVEHEFKDETSVDVLGTPLKTTARSTGVRLGFGGEFGGGEGVVLRVRADYTTSGGDTNEYGAGVQLNLRF